MSKGLKFTPPPPRNEIELKKDIQNFTRKLRLREFFSEENNNGEAENESLVRNKGNFNPPRNRNNVLDIVVDYLNKQDFSDRTFKNASNLSKKEWMELKALRENKEIIIKEADKGGSVVIMNKEHYKRMIYEQLGDSETYQPISPNSDQLVMNKIGQLTEKYKQNLTKAEIQYLTNFSYTTSNFYGLPKVHKSKLIADAVKAQNSEYIVLYEPSDLVLRPIVAGPVCPSDLVDKLLKPYIKYIKSYVRDDLDFLSKVSRKNDKKLLLTTFDVVGLYTNIPHNYGLEAINYWLDKFPETLNSRFNKSFIIESTEFILQNNNMKFDDNYFKQIKGTAMGTIFAPTYATLTMGFFEIKFYNICNETFGTNIGKMISDTWYRFLDDCQIRVDESKVDPKELLNILNSINASIKFTMESSHDRIAFLDILIKRNKEKIWMDIYHKPTDTRRCLHFHSNHPSHCRRNIPFSLARRICTISENPNEKRNHLEDLAKNLRKYGYPQNIIRNGIIKATSLTQEELRTPKTIQNEDILPFVSTHNPNNSNPFNLIKSSIECLKHNKVDGFESVKVIHSKRQAPNLKKLLTKAEFSSTLPSVKKCDKATCKCCDNLQLGTTHKFKNTNYTFTVKSSFNCDSSNLIYVLTCPTCKEEYIGETGIGKTKLRDGVRVYRQHIKQPSTKN